METCIITGGTGLVGTHLLPELVERYQVYALAYDRHPILDRLPLTVIPADLSECHWHELLPEKIDHVVHLAQSEHFREFPERAIHLFSVNTASCMHLLDFARERGAKNFVHTSTGSVYPFGEQDCSPTAPLTLNPQLGFYPATKLCTEILANCYQPYMNVSTLRPFFIYGEGQQRHMLIPRLVDAVLEGRPIQLQEENGLCINPVHASDAARLILAALECNASKTYNLAGPEVLTLRDIGTLIGEAVGKEPQFEVNAEQNAPRLVGSTEGNPVQPQVRFKDGIQTVMPATV